MAAALVGVAFLSYFLNVVFDRLSSPEVLNWLKGKKVDHKLLRRLKTSLIVVRSVLNDAEQKQIIDPNVKEWLVDLEDAMYVADDLLDEVATNAATQKDPGNFMSQSLNLDDQRDMVAEIEDIIERLASIVELKDALRLKENADDTMSWRVPSTSLVEKSKIYGRDEDKEAIVKLLQNDNFDGEIPVICIVGIGGIGKTTLAQLVYNDDRVKGRFDYRGWVCVAEKFDVVTVTKTIIEAMTSGPCNMNNFDLLQTSLMEMLDGKTFLIVLDDLWSYEANLWKSFIKPFQFGKKGSKILVTTRVEKVASVNPIIQPYKLSLLSVGDCWSLFLKCSFLSTESRGYETLKKIGRKIVKKCNGLPLAVETLGGLLRTKHDVESWNDILESEIWEFPEDESMIIPALRISYHHLPSHLKRCFVYCSLFPQDYEFDKDELILLWMAEDFLQPMGRKTLEEVGCEYFNELVARSFFQPSKRDGRLFVMHGLMHNLATFCAGKFYFRADDIENEIEIGSIIRHLSCNDRDMYQVSKLLTTCHGAKYMRTFACMKHFGSKKTFPLKIDFSQLKCLRVLLFNASTRVTLHPSIGELIHMRYLDLSNTYIVSLPKSLGRLYNLQTLKLRGCCKLKMLPSGIQDLMNLRHLDISGTTSLEEMPKGISKLKHLQFLSDYVVVEHKDNKIMELGALVDLRGELHISHLENVISGNEALEARMSDKMYLSSLKLVWSSSNSIVVDSEVERDILDKLQPHPDLKELSVDGYRVTKFPDWLGHSSYKHMTHLTLSGCENCCALPSLGRLPSLSYLSISKFDSLISIGAEFYRGDESCQETPFPSLETLIFCNLKCWKEWLSIEFDNAFPQLKELTIDFCPMLIGDLPGHLPKLEKLNTTKSPLIHCFLPKAPAMLELVVLAHNGLRMQEMPPSIRSLRIEGSQLVEYVFEAMCHTQPAHLQSLSISDCDSTISFPGDCVPASLQLLDINDCKKLDFPTQQQQQHQSLQKLTISCSCDSLVSFPLSAFPNLNELKISGCENMESLVVSQSQSQDDTNLRLRELRISKCPKFVSFSPTLGMAAPQLGYLTISECPEIESFGVDEGGLPPNLRSLSILGCKKLGSRVASMDLSSSQRFTHLDIKGASESVKSFPKESCLPASLKYIRVRDFPSLETLDCSGLSHLTSLQYLRIWGCEKLENVKGERLPASLTGLHITGCPLIGKRCKKKDPLIWPKISHIKEIRVGQKLIS